MSDEARSVLLLDTSAAVPLLVADMDAHEAVVERTETRTIGLAGHALFETYSVLTRLPGDLRLTGAGARRIISHMFPATRMLSSDGQARAMSALANAGVVGGAVWDGLVALAAVEASCVLLTRDRRALGTYQRLGCDAELV